MLHAPGEIGVVRVSRVYRALEKAEQEKQEKARQEKLNPEKTEKESPLRFLRETPPPKKEERPSRPVERPAEKLQFPFEEQRPILTADTDTFAFEQFRKLRTQMFQWAPGVPRMVLVTSTTPDEGKTMVSFNLAVAISQEINKQAILVDADLRKPGILPGAAKGLTSYLLDQVPLSEILNQHETENLLIIPAGPASRKAAELIGSRKMAEFLGALRERGEETFIVIDSPPVLSTAEPSLLSKMVDGVILVVRADQTHREAVRRSLQLVGKEKVIGAVLNRVEMKSTRYYQGYYHKDYHGYHKK